MLNTSKLWCQPDPIDNFAFCRCTESYHKTDTSAKINLFYGLTCRTIYSPAETQLDLEVGFKVFIFSDSCWLELPFKNLTDDTVIIERFEKIKMASKMATKYIA